MDALSRDSDGISNFSAVGSLRVVLSSYFCEPLAYAREPLS
jgi:hypothetical protein